MNTLTRIEKFFNTATFAAEDSLFVGVDVHKKPYHVALYLNNAPSIDFVMPANKEQLSQKLKATTPALRQVAITCNIFRTLLSVVQKSPQSGR